MLVLPSSPPQSDHWGGRWTGHFPDSACRNPPFHVDGWRIRCSGPDGRAPAQSNPSHWSECGRQFSNPHISRGSRASGERRQVLGTGLIVRTGNSHHVVGGGRKPTQPSPASESTWTWITVHGRTKCTAVWQQHSVVLMWENGWALLASLCPGLGREELEAGGDSLLVNCATSEKEPGSSEGQEDALRSSTLQHWVEKTTDKEKKQFDIQNCGYDPQRLLISPATDKEAS